MSKSHNYCLVFLVFCKTIYISVSWISLYLQIFQQKQIPDVSCLLIRYVWSGAIVLLGIALNVYSKNKDKADAMFWRYWTRMGSKGKPATMSQEI